MGHLPRWRRHLSCSSSACLPTSPGLACHSRLWLSLYLLCLFAASPIQTFRASVPTGLLCSVPDSWQLAFLLNPLMKLQVTQVTGTFSPNPGSLLSPHSWRLPQVFNPEPPRALCGGHSWLLHVLRLLLASPSPPAPRCRHLPCTPPQRAAVGTSGPWHAAIPHWPTCPNQTTGPAQPRLCLGSSQPSPLVLLNLCCILKTVALLPFCSIPFISLEALSQVLGNMAAVTIQTRCFQQ